MIWAWISQLASGLDHEARRRERLWRDAAGNTYPISTMRTDHLENALALCKRYAKHGNHWTDWVPVLQLELDARAREAERYCSKTFAVQAVCTSPGQLVVNGIDHPGIEVGSTVEATITVRPRRPERPYRPTLRVRW